MTPAARVAAAIEVLDRVGAGEPAERALTVWARAHRFAGAKDRAAIRDHVYDALRRRRSLAALGGDESGRGLMIGALRAAGTLPETVFTGEGHAPAPLNAAERTAGRKPVPGPEALDCPDWIYPELAASLGAACDPVLAALRCRAPVHLRVNLRATTRAAAAADLAGRGVVARPHPLSPSALEIDGNGRGLRNDAAYLEGRVEFQDAASQAVADLVPVADGARFLDFCAGGGGKTLAVGARADAALFAHDAAPRRMADLPARARRAGLSVTLLEPGDAAQSAPYDAVLCDAPCSGSGSWRRDPEGKWRLTPERLTGLTVTQRDVLAQAAPLVAIGGALVYATCSLLRTENARQIDAFLGRVTGWRHEVSRQFTPLEGGDGFFVSVLRRAD